MDYVITIRADGTIEPDGFRPPPIERGKGIPAEVKAELERNLERREKRRAYYRKNREKLLAASKASHAKRRASKTLHWCRWSPPGGYPEDALWGPCKGDFWRILRERKRRAELGLPPRENE